VVSAGPYAKLHLTPDRQTRLITIIITTIIKLVKRQDVTDGTVFCIVQEQPEKAADLKRLDDDEDRQNPAFVPRKGAFFEHDLRRGSEDGTGKTETKPYVFFPVLDCFYDFGRYVTLAICAV